MSPIIGRFQYEIERKRPNFGEIKYLRPVNRLGTYPIPQMPVNGEQICDLEKKDGQICHTLLQYGDRSSTSQELATAI